MLSAWLESVRALTWKTPGSCSPGDFVHVGNHEEQALRRGVGGREGTRSERAVHGAGGTAFGFHLDDLDLGTEDIFGPMRGPLVDEVCHGA